MEQWTIIGILSGIILLGVMLMMVYVSTIDDSPAPINQDKKGRAVYLIDARLPHIQFDWHKFFNR
ncbi:MAG: hypothetical protein HYZ63_02995 [Candidatus Andersenbacteria bacterium]|nr:hypothetical protein [Candidatus Andersenbacteria bacterium]